MTKRTASEAFAKPQRSRSLSPPTKKSRSEQPSPPDSPSRLVQSAPARLEPRVTRLHRSSGPSIAVGADEVVNEDADPLLYRILSGLEYTRTQHAHGRPPMQTTRFQLSKREHLYRGSALSVLRRAGLDGHATRVAVDDEFELWEIGVPRPNWVAEGAFGGMHDAHWWVGLDAAQIKAGPHGTDADVKRARAGLKAAGTRRIKKLEKSQRENESDWKLREWHRRYKSGERMNDSDGSDTDRSLLAPGVSDDDSTDDGSDDEPITPTKIARWRAERKSRAAVAPLPSSGSRQSVSSESDEYRPSSSSGADGSESSPGESNTEAEIRPKPQRDESSAESGAASDSEDSGPLAPVFFGVEGRSEGEEE